LSHPTSPHFTKVDWPASRIAPVRPRSPFDAVLAARFSRRDVFAVNRITEMEKRDQHSMERNADVRDRATRFVELLTSHQRDLYVYINTMLLGHSAAADILQDTNLDLWASIDDFDFSRPFLPWAYTFAYHRILAFRKATGRSRLVFSDEILDLINAACVRDDTRADVRLAALQRCLEKLKVEHSQLIQDRYIERVSVKMLAARLGMSANQISARLYRIRKILAKCIDATFHGEAR
jgi:RNA polymerase sigma-70 factor, ECF subfamily